MNHKRTFTSNSFDAIKATRLGVSWISKMTSSLSFFVLFHTVIVIATGIVVYQILLIADEKNSMKQVDEQITLGQEKKEELKNPQNYLQSQTFRLKYAKRNYVTRKVDGEQVYDTSTFESYTNNPDINYIPSEYQSENRKTNLQRWVDCVVATDLSRCLR